MLAGLAGLPAESRRGMPRTALALYLGFLAVAFGWRTWLEYRLSGDHGFRGLSGRIGSLQWCGGALLAVGIVLSLAAPVADLLGWSSRLLIPTRPVDVIAVGLVLVGFALTIAALVPNLLSIAAFASVLAGLEIQVRLTEEPYLLRTHGSAYHSYARKVGRFLPGVGRLP
jgi:protein-S-isoprenylcysteine O-methyltransferase Ste14